MNSVLSLRVIKSIYNPNKPYLSPNNIEEFGTGFIIDIGKGLIMTNAHTVRDSISIIGRLARTGKRDISLEFVGTCYEKDVAICKILDTSLIIAGLTKPEIIKLELKFGESMRVKAGESVSGLAYFKSNDLKVLTGIVSGFKTIESTTEDSSSRSPGYIETTLEIDQGPLLNRNDEVIGMFSKNKCAIPSRTILCIYNDMINNKIVKMPTLGLEWCKTNRELMKKHTGSSSTYGIYVRKIYPDSCFDLLEKGDIIRRIDYVDMFWDSKGNSHLSISDLKFNGTLVTVFLDRFGMSNKIGILKDPDEVDENKIEFDRILTDRKMELSEIMDIIPIGTNMVLNMCRSQTWYKLKTKYISMESGKIDKADNDYVFFAGLCVANLNLDESIDKYKKQVIIRQVFPTSSADKTQSLKSGQLIKSIIGYSSKFELVEETNRCISSLDDVREVLKLKPEMIQITTTDDNTFLITTSTIIKEDQDIMKKYNISHDYLL